MYSLVEFLDMQAYRLQVFTICYPSDAAPEACFTCVTPPVRCSPLGLKIGDIARWHTPNGKERSAEMVSVEYQPEATSH